MKRYILAITGASGSIFGIRLLKEIASSNHVYLVVSRSALPIIRDETGLDLRSDPLSVIKDHTSSDNIDVFDDDNLYAPIASGSFENDGMFIAPCTMKTLSAIAAGGSSNLIERAADVIIKESRKLVLCPREMPFSPIHLENMLKLSRIGVSIAPPVPAFYNKPGSIDDMIDFVVGKLLDCMNIKNDLYNRWGGD